MKKCGYFGIKTMDYAYAILFQNVHLKIANKISNNRRILHSL